MMWAAAGPPSNLMPGIGKSSTLSITRSQEYERNSMGETTESNLERV